MGGGTVGGRSVKTHNCRLSSRDATFITTLFCTCVCVYLPLTVMYYLQMSIFHISFSIIVHVHIHVIFSPHSSHTHTPTQRDPEDFAEEQWVMGRMVHLLKASSADQQYMVGTLTPMLHCSTGYTKSLFIEVTLGAQ